MKKSLALATVLTIGIVVLGYVFAKPSLVWHYPGFPKTGISKMASWDAQENIEVAQGHSVGAETSDRMHRLVPLGLLWLITAGRPNAWGAVVLAFVGNILLTYAVARLLPQKKWLAAFVVLLPPLVSTTVSLLPITLGLGFALWGWESNNPWLLAMGGFTHDSLIAFALVRQRLRLVIVFLVWAAVTVIIWGSNPGTFGPFAILTQRKDAAFLHYTMLVATLCMAFFAYRISKITTVLFLGYICIMGPAQVYYWSDFTRILSPLWVLGFVAVVQKVKRPDSTCAGAKSGLAKTLIQ